MSNEDSSTNFEHWTRIFRDHPIRQNRRNVWFATVYDETLSLSLSRNMGITKNHLRLEYSLCGKYPNTPAISPSQNNHRTEEEVNNTDKKLSSTGDIFPRGTAGGRRRDKEVLRDKAPIRHDLTTLCKIVSLRAPSWNFTIRRIAQTWRFPPAADEAALTRRKSALIASN